MVCQMGSAVSDLNDFTAAKGAGFGFIGMADHTNPVSDFQEQGAEAVNSFEELEKII